ncbi:anhydro-N-acetylmuramic acid kinase [Flammeovirga sp. EKP202]|uniref:anhydro-N-acetylmuramic acid kinase n=1 Tax=Flammeovirga sp. EKP202 TaxID=2770592 RepID=UPI00165F46A2|nr:anhydro-N-acetylmuramic acid kinase [Flammeovirga sp. EKP202]MBD0400995.1 anhydro-N-acetylmuramic acid kinase [Flammeovirga sp. EKP202]
MSSKNKFRLIGVMSGTSLDGIDLCYAEFWKDSQKQWRYSMPHIDSVDYDDDWKTKLDTAEHLSALEYIKLDRALGRKMGMHIRSFIDRNNLKVDFVCSHGHTIFHQPEIGITSQIGHGPAIARYSGCNVINDFRVSDLAFQGQGAPLVPIGDRLLFHEYHYRLNLGGIGNISFEVNNETIAFDTSPANMPLNYFMREIGKEFDEDGQMSRQGNINQQVLDELNQLSFYEDFEVKSLGKEWFVDTFLPIITKVERLEDRLATSVEHTAIQVGKVIEFASQKSKLHFGKEKLLITGGGAFNSHLIERIKAHCPDIEIVIPKKEIITHKEALLFAFLGCLRLKKEVNCLKSVTGATIDNCGGVIHYPFVKEEEESTPSLTDSDEMPSFNKIIGCGG